MFSQNTPCDHRFDFDVWKCNPRQKWNNDKCQSDCKNQKDIVDVKKSTCTYQCDKDCEIDEYLKYCECMKSLVNNASFIW